MSATWVLIETLATEREGRPIYFRFMTAIGPCATAELEEAKRFSSERSAMRSPAYRHSLSFYEPLEVKR